MLFSSITFLYYFLPCVLLLYFVVPKSAKAPVLLLASLLFYGWGEPKYLIFMGFTIVQGYVFGRCIENNRGSWRSKLFLAASVVCSLALLGYCKYVDFFITNFNAVTGLLLPLMKIALPLGISFYTFQMMSYVIDVYRGTVQVQKNFMYLALYVSMFPQLVAGPIVRYSDRVAQLAHPQCSLADASDGMRRFIIGLSKKVLLANQFGELAALYKATETPSVLFTWLYAIAFTLQIYFDFSGYSDMAIGLGRIFGFRFPENFNYPYIAGSITDFWRRWHMSLGTWFRDYLYIPLGGNRVKTGRYLFNVLIVWLATGFWHGAAWQFVIWGLLYAVLLILEKYVYGKYLKKLKIVKHIYVMLFVIIGFVIFDADNMSVALTHIQAMFGSGDGGYLPLFTDEAVYYLRSYGVLMGIGIIGATPLPKWVVSKGIKLRSEAKVVVSSDKVADGLIDDKTIIFARRASSIIETLVLIVLLLVCTAFLIDSSYNPFLYFRF